MAAVLWSIAIVMLVITIGLIFDATFTEPAEAQTEAWTPYPIQTYKIPMDTGSGHVLRMYNPNGNTTCYMWIAPQVLPIGCVAGKR